MEANVIVIRPLNKFLSKYDLITVVLHDKCYGWIEASEFRFPVATVMETY